MKKLFTIFMLGAAGLSASAQGYEGHKFFDNWSLGVIGGAVAPTTHHSVFSDARGVAGLELTKGITPVFSVGVQSVAGFNTLGICGSKGAEGSYTVVDNVNTTFFGKGNLSNLFFGYTGTPRFFEVEAMAGVGINHYFGNGGLNSATSKVGLNFNFNLGESKAWTVSLRPAMAWDWDAPAVEKAQMNINSSALELTAGVTYHFKSSNGAHHFTVVRPYDQAEVDGLNAKINDLRGQMSDKDKAISAKDAQLRQLQQELNDARNKKPAVQQVVNTKETKTLESYVTFRQGKSVVDASQLPNVERIATYMKNHKNAKVSIKGYASPEGSIEINTRIAKARAEAVKNILVNKYKIAASRITAEGQGVGNMFEEPDWNRVSICTLGE